MASLVVQWSQLLHEDSDVHQDPSLPENVDETYFLQVSMPAWMLTQMELNSVPSLVKSKPCAQLCWCPLPDCKSQVNESGTMAASHTG
jgi:hypothetical protein